MRQQETIEWVSTGDESPEQSGLYLVTMRQGYVRELHRLPPWERDDEKNWAYPSNGRVVPYGEVIAWAKLPAPYRTEAAE